MGVEVMELAAGAIQRRQRRELAILAGGGLFGTLPPLRTRLLAAPVNGSTFRLDEEVLIQLVEPQLFVLRGHTQIGVIVDPPESVIAHIRVVGNGFAVGVVVNLLKVADYAEIEIA